MSRRTLGLCGLLFVVIVIVAIALTGNSPASNASVASLLSYYHNHRGNQLACAYLLELGVVVGVFFFWYLRDLLIESQADRRLVNLGFVGVIFFATSGALAGGLRYALWDYMGNSVISVSTLQTLNTLQQDANVVLSGVGQGIFLLVTGVALITSGVLARWLGWLGVVLGVIGLALPFLGPVPTGIWVIISSIVILVGARTAAPSQGAALGSPAGAE